MFYIGTQSPSGCGFPCRDALNSEFDDLFGPDDLVMINCSSVSLQLCWPGYPDWGRQIPTRDSRISGPITRTKLVKSVAQTIQRFIEDMEWRELEEGADPCFKVGPEYVDIDDLEVLGLQNVGMGNWQIHVRVRPRA